MLQLWLSWKYFKSGGRFLNVTTVLALLGMVLGVSLMVVSMSVVSGYETTLKNAVIDVLGDLVIVKRNGNLNSEEIHEKILPLVDGYKAYTPYLVGEALIAQKSKLQGVIIEGVDPQTYDKVLRLKSHLKEGKFLFKEVSGNEIPPALVGSVLAEKFHLRIGDEFKVVVPEVGSAKASDIRPRLEKFRLVGILNLGQYDYDRRYIMTSLSTVQKIFKQNGKITGIRIKIKDDKKAHALAFKIRSDYMDTYWAQSWWDANITLFKAVDYEKPILFLVLSIIIIAACFNVTSTLLVNVLKRFRDISVLKSLGASPRLLMQVFALQGLYIGFFGSLLGLYGGYLGSKAFVWIQTHYHLFQTDVYKLNGIQVELRMSDLVIIVSMSMFICFLSTLIPARKAARLDAIKGLRYE